MPTDLKELIEDVLNGRYGTMNRTELLSRLNLIQKECNPTPIKEEPKKIELLVKDPWIGTTGHKLSVFARCKVADHQFTLHLKNKLNEAMAKIDELIEDHNKGIK